jgi:hypothetical protein
MQPPLHLQPTFSTHAWSLQPGHRNSRALAASWLTLASSTELKAWEEKRGGFYQHETHHSLICSHLDELRVRLRASSEALGRSVLHGVDVDATSLQLVDIKLLRAATGKGQQEVHYDVLEYEFARQCYTVLLYLTATELTAVPKAPLNELRDTFTEGEKKPSPSALHKLRRNSFHTCRVDAGDLLAFNAAVPHFGVANPDLHDRYVLFLHFSPRGTPLHDTEEQRYPLGVPISRSKRPYHTLQPTQKWERKTQARKALEAIDCPPEALVEEQRTTPQELIHLSTSVREQIRSVPRLRVPSEKTIINCKRELASTHATETGTFANGAYITDPVRFVSVLSSQSSLLTVGGDAGGGHTKLGITYCTPGGTQAFAALLVYAGKDSWADLHALTAPAVTPFIADSSNFPHIFAVLQHFIDTRSAFLNGDWSFINGVLGLMSPSATHPCPICIVSHNNFLRTARYRSATDKHSVHRDQSPLLTIPPERIVPTPLHLFLGISNRIILGAYKELFGEAVVQEAVARVKTIHSAGCGGASDLYDLNGPEITQFIKRQHGRGPFSVITSAASCPAASRAAHSLLSRWLQQLHSCLLHSRDWALDELESWRSAVIDIHQHWQAETHSDAFPKLHMLHHTIEFAERHRFLGRASEAQMEAFHAQFNTLFHDHHLNQGSNTSERLRRSLADATLRAIQSLVR